MKRKLLVFILSAVMVSFSQKSHSGADHHGHNHDAPGLVQAPKGGLIKSLDSIHVEVVNKGKNIQIHFYDHAMKQVDAKGIVTLAEVALPRSKGKEKITLIPNGQSLEYTYDAKKAHRYTLHLLVTDPTEKQPTNLTFTVEPKKGK
jgi:hypothetical protein